MSSLDWPFHMHWSTDSGPTLEPGRFFFVILEHEPPCKKHDNLTTLLEGRKESVFRYFIHPRCMNEDILDFLYSAELLTKFKVTTSSFHHMEQKDYPVHNLLIRSVKSLLFEGTKQWGGLYVEIWDKCIPCAFHLANTHCMLISINQLQLLIIRVQEYILRRKIPWIL
jgi:hypothetical protein